MNHLSFPGKAPNDSQPKVNRRTDWDMLSGKEAYPDFLFRIEDPGEPDLRRGAARFYSAPPLCFFCLAVALENDSFEIF